MKKVVLSAVFLAVIGLLAGAGVSYAEPRQFLASGGYDPHEIIFTQAKRVAIGVIIFTDLVKNEILPMDETRLATATIQQHMAATMTLKESLAARLQTGEAVTVSQYAEPALVLKEELRRQLSGKGFTIVKEGTPNVLRLKIYGARKGSATDINRFIGVVAELTDLLGQKAAIAYDAGAMYSTISSSQDEVLEKIAASLAGIINDAFTLKLLVNR